MMMTPWVQRLLIANVVIYAFTASGVPHILEFGGLVPAALGQRPWTIATYMFLHGSFPHVLFNMLMLFFFGPRLEERLGSRTFLWFYLASGVGGALLSFAFTPGVMIIGASGAVYGVVVGFARYWPREPIHIWGILPVQARWLALFMVGSSLFSGITGARSGIAHFAHLGGLAAGWVFLKLWEQQRGQTAAVAKRQPRYKATGAQEADVLERWNAIPRDQLHEINREELEALLAKADQAGIRALTNEDRAFLERMAKSVQAEPA